MKERSSSSRASSLLVIVGPTATGKTAVGIACAQQLDGEIVSADSMQVYRGMDIGTAKPTLQECGSVPHHLIDIADPDEDFSVARYKELAEAAIDDIFSRGKQPILVGGSGLHVRSIIGRWSMTLAPKDAELRRRLQAQAQTEGIEALHRRLAAIDPKSAELISAADEKRIIRALEVFETTGQPLSHFHQLDASREPKYTSVIVGLTGPREVLYARIEARIDQMMQQGFLEEVTRLREKGYRPHLTSMKALGYSHLQAFLEGANDLETAVKLLKRDTRRFAKRQMTWFRAEPGIIWLDMTNRNLDELAAEIAGLFASSSRV